MKKVLMFNGSPNPSGSTYTALMQVAKGLAEYGVEHELVQLGKRSITGCTACWACHKNPERGCVLPDGDFVNACIRKIEECDGLVVGSPVYFASANGTLVSLLDRVFSRSGGFVGKPEASVVAARRAGSTATLDQINKYFMVARMPMVASSYWNMVFGNRPEEAVADGEGMETMYNLGRNMGWLISSIEAGKAAGIPALQTR